MCYILSNCFYFTLTLLNFISDARGEEVLIKECHVHLRKSQAARLTPRTRSLLVSGSSSKLADKNWITARVSGSGHRLQYVNTTCAQLLYIGDTNGANVFRVRERAAQLC